MSPGKVRVLVVDDSAFMRTAVARTLETDARIEVVGQARDGEDAVVKARELRPDVITMDFNMPRKNGAEAIRAICAERPTPVVMLSAHTFAGAKETIDALSAGAVDFVTKPDGEISTDLSGVRDELVKKVLAASHARPQALPAPPAPASPRTIVTSPASPPRAARAPEPPPSGEQRISFAGMVLDPVVIIGISTGGPAALEQVIPRLPAGFTRGVLVVQHMPAHFTRALAERLDVISALTVREAQANDRLAAGTVLVAPGDQHVVLQPSGMIRLVQTAPVNGCRPSVDVTLQSAATLYGSRLVTVIMTGMGRDGAVGAAAVRAAGGKVLAQDRETSVVYGMPRAVIEAGTADEVLPLGQIAARLARAGR